MDDPTIDDVTVILLSYNHERYIRDALESIARQSIGRPKLVVVDDASNDRTVAVARDWLQDTKYDASVIAHRVNAGVCRSFNDGLNCVTTSWVCIMSADDWMEADRFERQLSRAAGVGAEVGVIYSDASYVNDDGTARPGSYIDDRLMRDFRPEGDILGPLVRGSFLPPHALLIRTIVFDHVGVFDESLEHEDYDMWLRIAAEYEFAFAPGKVVVYRNSDNSLSEILYRNSRQRVYLDLIRALEKQLGKSADLDKIIWNEVRFYLLVSYWHGGRDKEFLRRMRMLIRRQPSAVNIAYGIAMHCGIPGRVVFRLKNFRSRSSMNDAI